MLLTGKNPDELYDNYSDRWNWRAYAQVSDRLEAVLNRMLQAAPNQRFQSAAEVLQALTPPTAPVAAPAAAPRPAPSPAPAPPARPIAAPATQAQAAVPPVSPAPVAANPKAAAVRRRAIRRSFSLAELIGGAAFTGFEGGLVAIGAGSLLGLASPTWLIVAGMVTGALVLAQYLRWIEKVDLFIIAAGTLAAITFLAPLHKILIGGGAALQVLPVILPFALLSGLGVVAVALIFRLIYTLLSRLM
jgi:hypothetical protein